MTNKIFFTLLGVVFAFSIYAQNADTIYFNQVWQETVSDSAYYYRVQYFNEDDKLFHVRDYYPNDVLQMTGSYVSFDPQIRQGKFFWFYSNGNLRQVTEYNQNEIIDIITSFDEQGNMIESFAWADVDTPPEFPGGLENFLRYIDDNLRYPKKAVKKGIQGRVVVAFVLDKEGKPDRVRVTKSANPMLDSEAIRVIKNSPAWKPSFHQGESVEVSLLIPIDFILRKKEGRGLH